jgi:hypothetical protein
LIPALRNMAFVTPMEAIETDEEEFKGNELLFTS